MLRHGVVRVWDTWTGEVALTLKMVDPIASQKRVVLQMPLAFDPSITALACGFDPSQSTLGAEESNSSMIYVWRLPWEIVD